MIYAAKYGRKIILEDFIRMGSNWLNNGLLYATLGKQLNIMILLINLGANNLESAMLHAVDILMVLSV